MTDVRFNTARTIVGHDCGGTLVHPKYVLSARHCFTTDSTQTGILMTAPGTQFLAPGRYQLTDATPIVSPTLIIDNPDQGNADLVLLQLANDVAQPTTRLMTEAAMGTTYVGEPSYLLGWGTRNGVNGPEFPDKVNEGLATFLGTGTQCTARPATAAQVCTGTLNGSIDLCHADSGGPGLLRRNGRWHQNGVISYLGCDTSPYLPGLLVRVASYNAWISNTLPQTEGVGQLHNVPNPGLALGAQLQQFTGWGSHWEKIVPGDFNGDGNDDLFFYRGSTGAGAIYFSDASGSLTSMSASNTFSSGWSTIITGDFTSDPGKEILFYNAGTGAAAFYNVSNTGSLSLVQASTFATGWEQIVPGNFNGSGFDDLFFYKPAIGNGSFYSTNGAGQLSVMSSSNTFGSGWDVILPGKFNADATTDLFFYNGTSGTVTYGISNGSGGFSSQVSNTGISGDWTEIKAIENGTGRTGFFFYNQSTGNVVWAQTLSGGGLGTQASASGFARHWADVIPMSFNGFQDLMFYSQWGR